MLGSDWPSLSLSWGPHLGPAVLSLGRTLKVVFFPLFHMEEKKEAEVEIQREDSPKVSELVGLDFPLL